MRSREIIIEAWKNPARRAAIGTCPVHPSGNPMEHLNPSEMSGVFGGGDVQADTIQIPTPVTPAAEATVATSAVCIGVGSVGFIGGVAVTYTLRHHCF